MPTSRHPQKRCSSSPGLARPHPLVAPGDPPRRHTPCPAAHPARPHHRLVMLATRPPSQCTTFASEATNATVMLGLEARRIPTRARAIAFEVGACGPGGGGLFGVASLAGRSDAVDEFAEVFGELEDPRTGNARRHLLLEILLIALCAVLSGGEDCTDMALFGRAKEPFLRQFLRLPSGVPSHDTFSRVFRLLDPTQFHACFLRFVRRFAEATRGVVAVDGKALRRSFHRAADVSPLHLVSAWAVEQRLVLGQVAVDGKSNEITAVPELLALLSLEGTIVTADALNCQRHTAETVLARGGDYVLALKGTQGPLHTDVSLFLDDPRRSREASHT